MQNLSYTQGGYYACKYRNPYGTHQNDAYHMCTLCITVPI